MHIVSLQISGFRNYDVNTQLNFLDEHKNLIFDAESDKKVFIFETILGIIFGFTPEEKQKFRGNPEVNKTYTGLITLELDERTMMIERDFETDFVACLISDTKTTRPIFQGKDTMNNGYSRPYLDMLKSVFPIIDKELFREVCYVDPGGLNQKLSDLLDTLYLLLTPQFKFSSTKMLVNETNKIIHRLNDAILDNHVLNKLEMTKAGIEHLLEIERVIKKFKIEQQKLNLLIEKISDRNKQTDSTHQALNENFAAIKDRNPLQLRADILLWKSLKQIKANKENELASVLNQKARIKNILENDLFSYAKLPDHFTQKVNRFKEINERLGHRQKQYDDLKKEINLNKNKLDRSRRISRFLLFGLPPFVFILFLLIFKTNWLIVVPGAFILSSVVLSLLGHFNFKRQSHIYRLQEESHILQKQINHGKDEIAEFEESSKIFSNPDHLDTHLERFQKYRKYVTDLKRLDKQEVRIKELLESKSYARQLPDYEQKYSQFIDIDRPDLEEYLDEFVQLKNQLLVEERNKPDHPVTEDILLLCSNYENAINELSTAQARLSRELKVDNGSGDLATALDQVDRKIKNFHLHYGYKASY